MTRVGIIGYGLAGEVFHAPLVDAVEGLEVAAIVTRDPDRQRRAAAAYPEASVVADVEELWPLAEAVVVASSNRSHVPLGLAAVERGLPVVVDKPLAPSLAEAERLVAAAEGRGVLLTVFQNRRWDGDFLTLQKRLDFVGSPIRLESRFERSSPSRRAAGASLATRRGRRAAVGPRSPSDRPGALAARPDPARVRRARPQAARR